MGFPGITGAPRSTLGLGANDDNVSTIGGDSGTLIYYHGSNGGDAKNDDKRGIIPLEKVKADLTNDYTSINTQSNDKAYLVGK